MSIEAASAEFQFGAREGPVRNIMRFHLVYSGPLSASGNKSKPEEIAAIRAKISPQLQNLWSTHHSLQVLLREGATPPASGGIAIMRGEKGELGPRDKAKNGWGNDLLTEIQINCTSFLPLVRRSLSLNCELDILFLRQQDPGQLISQGGDIDNRVKTLLDALRNPEIAEDKRSPTIGSNLVYTLMESDTLVSRLNIDTDRLLVSNSAAPNEAHLVIEVTLNVLRVGPHNMCLV